VVNDIEISFATADDARELAKTIREADRLELEATSGRGPEDVLDEGLRVSSEVWVARYLGRVMAIWGIVPSTEDTALMGPRVGAAWLLTSTIVNQAPKAFWQACKTELALLLHRWDMLVNWVDCRHLQALRWGSRLGFVFDEPAPYGVQGLPFRRFTLTRETLNV
jgi:hypothetical protein